jgi:hypothetical protein
VKAYRKLVRDRSLPPVLVWFVGGLATSVIIDATTDSWPPPPRVTSRPCSNLLGCSRWTTTGARLKWSDLDELARLERVLE